MSLQVQQRDEYQGNDWWRWSVWIEGGPGDLEGVESVTYTLHPTFPEPVHVIRDPGAKFRLDAAGWGEFEITATARHWTGAVTVLKHWLVLRYPPGSTPRQAGRTEPLIFLASSAADAGVAEAIRTGLQSHGMRVVTGNDAPLGLPPDESVRSLARQANASVAVVSAASSPSLAREIGLMREHEVAVIPVLVGEAPRKIDTLEGVEPFKASGEAEIQDLIPRLAAEIRSRAIWE